MADLVEVQHDCNQLQSMRMHNKQFQQRNLKLVKLFAAWRSDCSAARTVELVQCTNKTLVDPGGTIYIANCPAVFFLFHTLADEYKDQNEQNKLAE